MLNVFLESMDIEFTIGINLEPPQLIRLVLGCKFKILFLEYLKTHLTHSFMDMGMQMLFFSAQV